MSKYYCHGCGTVLQTDDSQAVGYVDDLKKNYCLACFRLKNYGIVSDNHLSDTDFELDDNAVFLHIISILQLDLIITFANRFRNNSKHIYIINQIDLLPSTTNLDLLLKNIIKKFQENHVYYEDIILMSALNKVDINNLKMYLKQYHQKKVFLIGLQNSGKTTIFKALTGNTEALSMMKAGLTQGRITGHLDSNEVIDLPGFWQTGYLSSFLSYEIYKKIIPNKKIKPRIYQLKQNDSIVIENLISISMIKGLEQTVVFYVNNNMQLQKTNIKKTSVHLTKKELIHVDDYKKVSIKTLADKRSQVTIADLGFIHFITAATLEIIHPKGMHISMTEALFK